MLPFHLITVVWGERFTSTFLEIVLPSQLASGNLPTLSRARPTLYKIYTRAADARTISQSAAYRRLADLLTVEFFVIDEAFEPLLRHANSCLAMSRFQKHAIRNGDGAFLSFLSPDAVLSDGTFAALHRHAEAGADVVMMNGLRMNLDDAGPELIARFRRSDGTLVARGCELVDVLLRHPHPITQSLNWGTPLFHNSWPSPLTWSSPNTGIVAHAWHPHPILVKARSNTDTFMTTIDGDYMERVAENPERIHVISESDEACIIEMSQPSHLWETVSQGKVFDRENFDRWLVNHTREVHRRFATKPFVYRACGGLQEDLTALEREAAEIIADINRVPSGHNALQHPTLKDISELKGLPSVYIYGCGESGKTLYQGIRDMGGVNFKGFIDTFRSGTLESARIFQLDEYKSIHVPTDTIVIASMHAPQIVEALQAARIHNWIDAQNLFEVMRFEKAVIHPWQP